MRTKVTIGMCGLNCQSTVVRAIDSVRRQDFPREMMEIVFVDDGSKDNTLRIVKDYLSKLDIPSKIFSDEWHGLGKARNTVIANASGDYIIWLDADEIMSRGFVRSQIKTIELNPNAGIVVPIMGIPDNGNSLLILELLPHIVEYSRQDWTGESKFPGTGGTTYRVAAIEEVGGFNEAITTVGEDIEIASRIRLAGWTIVKGDGIVYETHGDLSTIPNFFRRSLNQGVQARKLYQNKQKFYSLRRINPFASAIASIFFAVNAYTLTKRKIAFLLPLHFSVKMLVFFYGYCKA